MNVINVIHPFKQNGQWVFNDESKDLDKEPFVAGADTLLDKLTDYSDKCTVIFSAMPFPDSQEVIENLEPQVDGKEGTFYYHRSSDLKLWLCPALLHYFNKPPLRIYLKVKL